MRHNWVHLPVGVAQVGADQWVLTTWFGTTGVTRGYSTRRYGYGQLGVAYWVHLQARVAQVGAPAGDCGYNRIRHYWVRHNWDRCNWVGATTGCGTIG